MAHGGGRKKPKIGNSKNSKPRRQIAPLLDPQIDPADGFPRFQIQVRRMRQQHPHSSRSHLRTPWDSLCPLLVAAPTQGEPPGCCPAPPAAALSSPNPTKGMGSIEKGDSPLPETFLSQSALVWTDSAGSGQKTNQGTDSLPALVKSRKKKKILENESILEWKPVLISLWKRV